MYPVNGSTELVEILQGPWVVPDGQLLGHNSPLMDPMSKIGPGAGALNFVLLDFETCLFNGFNGFFNVVSR